MQEAELGWATYYLEVCLTPEEAEAAYLRWHEQAREHPGAEIRLLQLHVADTRALYCIVTQSREVVPPDVLRWHERLAAHYEASPALGLGPARWGAMETDRSDPPPPIFIDRTAETAWERGVRTPEAWDAFRRSTARKRRRG